MAALERLFGEPFLRPICFLFPPLGNSTYLILAIRFPHMHSNILFVVPVFTTVRFIDFAPPMPFTTVNDYVSMPRKALCGGFLRSERTNRVGMQRDYNVSPPIVILSSPLISGIFLYPPSRQLAANHQSPRFLSSLSFK